MKVKMFFLVAGLFLCFSAFAQMALETDSVKVKKDSIFKAIVHADSLKLEAQFAETAHWAHIKAVSIFPAVNAGEYSGVIPVKNITEVPDLKQDYKLLFEVTVKNPDSVAKELNYSLVEIARLINLHVASGISLNKIMPVIVVHGGALNAISNNQRYQKKYHIDNPNVKLLTSLEKMGARIIACGQAMAFFQFQPEDLLPEVKVSLTAQTVLSNYQLKGYVLYSIQPDQK